MSLVELETIDVNNKKIIVLYLNNPSSKNSMSEKMAEEFSKSLNSIKEISSVSCLILAGRNEIFSGGGDLELLKSFAKKSEEENKKFMYDFYNSFLGIRRLSIPVIGAINGHAIGAALSLAFACDIRIFAREGKYSFNFVKLGIHPGMGASYITEELFGKSISNELLFLGDAFSGEWAHSRDLCIDSVPKSEVVKRSVEIAISFTESSSMALKFLKSNIYDDSKLQEALKKEAIAQAKNFISEDFQETIRSIQEKRKPVFKGI
ncbi:MAG: enoyl-CoA hydratase/isomerase family protein [Leptospiraceae bacterium]|nr:enoyl-CoA hydratase/isomerase family protein [Leptospiraceae bacterium]MCK6381705.1 enoyl-CoA hydratase/isomerase family protein [Leptospiraceae bacterium]NUM42067.1 enoyl-CoA hydratase/isomerase family protein [Leptospiraceae bacterium]